MDAGSKLSVFCPAPLVRACFTPHRSTLQIVCVCVCGGGGGDVDVDWPCKAPRSQVRKPSVYNCFIRPLILFVASRRVPGIVVERRQVWVRCAGRRGAIASDAAAAIIRTGGGLPRPVL